MRALRNYHARTSVRLRILNLLQEAEIYLVRELYDHCHYALERAGRLAETFEEFGLHLDVIGWQRRLSLARGAAQSESLGLVAAGESRLLRKASLLNRTWDLTTRLYESTTDANFIKTEFIAKPRSHSTIRSETLRYHIRYSWNFMRGNRKRAEREVNALIGLLEAHPHRISEDPAPYVTALGNKISMLLDGKRWDEASSLIARMRAVHALYNLPDNSRFTLRLWLRLYNLELECYRDSGQNLRAVQLAAEINGFLKRHSGAIPGTYRLIFHYQFALVHYREGDLRGALREVNELINGNFGGERMDLQCAARLLNLVLHFELGNILVLRYAVDSCKRFLAKNKQLGDSEKVLLRLFAGLSHARKNEYGDLKRKAEAAYPGESRFDYFDFRAWMNGSKSVR
jgi:hypothetical protein